MERPDVYRNARYELRLARLEAGFIQIFDGLQSLALAMSIIKGYLEAAQEQLPGERSESWHPESKH